MSCGASSPSLPVGCRYVGDRHSGGPEGRELKIKSFVAWNGWMDEIYFLTLLRRSLFLILSAAPPHPPLPVYCCYGYRCRDCIFPPLIRPSWGWVGKCVFTYVIYNFFRPRTLICIGGGQMTALIFQWCALVLSTEQAALKMLKEIRG